MCPARHITSLTYIQKHALRGKPCKACEAADINVAQIEIASHFSPECVRPGRQWSLRGVKGRPTFYYNMLNDEDWTTVFEVYKEHRLLAFNLACNFIDIKQAIERGKKREAVKTVDQAIEALFLHTDFCKVGRKFYRQKLNDTLTRKQEKRLRKIGVKV